MKRAWNRVRMRVWVLRRNRAQFSAGRIDCVSCGIEGHGANSQLGLHHFIYRIGVGRILANDRQCAVPTTGEDASPHRIVDRGIDPFSDRKGCHGLP